MKLALTFASGLLILIGLTVLAIAVGSTTLPTGVVMEALGYAVTGQSPADDAHPLMRIVLDLRLPRALLALVVGAGLGIVGCLLQTVTRNDLADPFLFGLSSGAAAGAVLVITVTGDMLGIWTLPIAAFVGGLLASAIVLLLVTRLEDQGPARLVLAGLAVSFLFAAITNYMVFAGDQRAAHSVLFWTLGGLGLARWELLPIALAGLAAVLIYAQTRHRQLDALLAGDDTAMTLGVNVPAMRAITFLVCAFATAAFVSLTGVIGFVGLMVPHLARSLVGPLHRSLTLLAAVIGAGLLVASDTLARTILMPQELPVGIVTTSIGALFVLLILRKV
ncbi:iron ABC transporter permease [Ahrensia sp. R2A130]|uniref:FecCD family ABC transporter permease n=1 Tax=Ahrensia sp. R2A130 TaxID=744979 RepID=UPI0001E0C324|nr:iron ABC transporter permease [Ahrensia sp. R2A130]EFL90796.1 hemin transport system permease protein HmuU [Ahrensia sp. R2A130]